MPFLFALAAFVSAIAPAPAAAPASAPQSLSWWDLALLKALASTRSDALADIQRHQIRDHIVEEMAKVPLEER